MLIHLKFIVEQKEKGLQGNYCVSATRLNNFVCYCKIFNVFSSYFMVSQGTK